MNKINSRWSRRKFILSLSGTGAAMMLNPFSSLAETKSEINPKAAKIVTKTIGIDTHNHIDVPFDKTNFNSRDYDLSGEIKKSGFSAICMTFQVDRPELTKKGEAFPRFLTVLDEMDEILANHNIKRALNYSDIKKAHREKQPIVIQSVEGGHFIEGQLERIEIAYNRGLRHLGLLHDNPSYDPLGDIYTNPEKYGGLTASGIDVVKECNHLGILVDLAHCSDKAINDALKVSTKPVLISHTGLNTRPGNDDRVAKMMMPRLISKEQAKIVADAGGVIGVWTHLAYTPLGYAENIRAMVDVVGTEHVCIGTDSHMAMPPDSKQRFAKTTNTIWKDDNEGFFYTLVDAMLKTGFTENEIIKICGGNYFRLFDASTKSL